MREERLEWEGGGARRSADLRQNCAPKNGAPKNCARRGITVAIIETSTKAFALRSGSPAARATKSGRATFSIASWYLPPAPYEPSTRRSSMKSEV